MRKFYSIFALCAFLFLSVSILATEVTISDSGTTNSQILPIALQGTSEFMPKYSISQEIYLAEELLANGAFIGDITAIKYYYPHTANTTETRNLQVWIMESDLDEFSMTADDPGQLVYDAEYKAGTLVYQGAQTLSRSDYTITFNKNGGKFHWNGSKNIIITVYDETGTACAVNRHRLMATSAPRFLHQTTYNSSPTWNMSDLRNTAAKSYKSSESEIIGHKYVNKITFTFVSSETVPAVPNDMVVSATTSSSATLSWSSVSGATSYDLQQSANGSDWSTLALGITGTSHNWTGLSAESTQFARIRANNAVGSSDWSSAVTVTTDAEHIHDGISFNKWASTTSLPTSGNYYLNDDVALDPFDPTTITLTGNLNLCLNGHTANVYGTKIVVPSDKTLAIYDNVGGGKITGFVASEVGTFDIYAKALIVVFNGGELELKQGTVENTYVPDEDGSSYAIYSNGTLHLSGDVLINSNNADIYLYASNVITLDGAISNAEKHTVYKLGGDITYGWSTHMSGEDPRDFFESANSAKSVFLDDDEAALRNLLHLSENSLNSAIKDNRDIVIDVALTRSLTSSQFNTFCLPFNLNNAQLEKIFGVGYDLEEFDHSNFDGETIELVFVKRTELTEGAPYLIKPSVDVVDPFFVGVTIHDGEPGADDWDDYINVYSTFKPTELAGGNKNLLFLGAGNELFWPAATGNINGFRAYFEVKGAAQKAKAARIVKKEDQAQAIDNIENSNPAQKRILNGQLVIEKNGTFYNAQGQIVK